MLLLMVMKQILLGALMLITAYGAQSQTNLIDVEVSQNPTIEETQMVENITDTTPKHHPPLFAPLPPHARIQPPMMRGNFPKPEKIIRKGDKVIFIFDKKDFEKFRRWDLLQNKRRLETEREWGKKLENNSIPKDYMEKNAKKY